MVSEFLLLAMTCLGQSSNFRAPTTYDRIVPRIYSHSEMLYKNLRYEGNNISMRGPKNTAGNYVNGALVASRWQAASTCCKAIFVLRDSLYSQQDHPYRHRPHSLILPPSWVTSATFLAKNKKAILLPIIFPIDDDNNWATITSPQELFGSFPPSDALFKRVTGKIQNLEQKRNARQTIIQMYSYAKELAQASKLGATQVLQVGSELISKSDCNYFGTSVRQNHIIPIFVENPNVKEKSEGKGTAPPHLDIPTSFIDGCTKTIYKRRLEDGDIAIERYDLSDSADCARATSLLEALVPNREEGTTKVWVWVTGPLNAKEKLMGQDAMRWIDQFKAHLETRNINMQRVALFSKPSITLPSGTSRDFVFHTKLKVFENANMSMSVNLSTKALQTLIESHE